MDSFAAIGLACGIIAFLDFGFKLVSQVESIHASDSGARAYNDDLSSSTQQVQRLASNLKANKSLSDQDNSLLEIAAICESLSGELVGLLNKLKARDPNAALNDWFKKDQKNDLELRLDHCRQQLNNLELTCLTRTDLLVKLNEFATHGQATSAELRSLSENIEYLRLASNVSCLDPEALAQIQSLLQLTDDAITKIRQARILDGLLFGLMNKRIEVIQEAHEKTFDWIFNNEDVHETEISSTYSSETETDESPDRDKISEYELEWEDPSESGKSNTNSQHGDIDSGGAGPKSDNSSFQWSEGGYHYSDSDSQPSIVSDSEVLDESIERPKPSQTLLRNLAGAHTQSDMEESSESSRQIMMEARDSLIDWLEKGTGIFYIGGKPGSGKSTLMKYLCRKSRTRKHLEVWAGETDLVLGMFFFRKLGSPLQSTIKGLIRGLLHCLLSESPSLIPLAFPTQWEASMQHDRVHVENEECSLAFEKVIATSQASPEHKLAFFIEGLDEFDGDHADLIRQLFVWTNKSQNVKLCISSREGPVFQETFKTCPQLRLQDLTRLDIRQYAKDKLSRMHFNDSENSEVHEHLLEEICNKSDGVFLWVTFVLRHIENGLINGDQLIDSMRIIDSLPTEIEPMLQQLLDSISPNNQKLAYSMLLFAQFCYPYDSRVSLMQYSFLEEYVEDKDFARNSAVVLFTPAENARRLDKAEKRVYGVCKGLLELRPGNSLSDFHELFCPPDFLQHYGVSEVRRHLWPCESRRRRFPAQYQHRIGSIVRLTHRSIAEFLDSPEFQQKAKLKLAGFDPFDAYCQTYLALLERVRLPRSYFNRPLKKQSLHTPNGTNWGQYRTRAGESVIFHSPSPSLRQNVGLRILQQIHLGQPGTTPRFCDFLNDIYNTVIKLNIQMPCKWRMLSSITEKAVRLPAAAMIPLACAEFGFYEYFQRISPDTHLESGDFLAAACVSVLGFPKLERPTEWNRALKTCQALFDLGASPDCSFVADREPAFHTMLKNWCAHYTPTRPLAILAFMLYHGANPRFTIVTHPTTFTRLIDEDKPPWMRVWFKSEHPVAGRKLQTTRLRKSRGTRWLVKATPQTLAVTRDHGYDITLRTLVALWFPAAQSDVLAQVIDWILALGAPVDAQHRAQLQAKFGAQLRPLFDPEDPGFVGAAVRQPENTTTTTMWPGGQVVAHWETYILTRQEDGKQFSSYTEMP